MATKKQSGTDKGNNKVRKVMHEYKEGEPKSGGRKKVTSRKQAVAIALSEAREAGANIPDRRSASKKTAAKGAKKTAAKKTAVKKSASKGAAKKTAVKKTAAKKSAAKAPAKKGAAKKSAAKKTARKTGR